MTERAAFVGSATEQVDSQLSGAVCVHPNQSGEWERTGRLTASEGEGPGLFGETVWRR